MIYNINIHVIVHSEKNNQNTWFIKNNFYLLRITILVN